MTFSHSLATSGSFCRTQDFASSRVWNLIVMIGTKLGAPGCCDLLRLGRALPFYRLRPDAALLACGRYFIPYLDGGPQTGRGGFQILREAPPWPLLFLQRAPGDALCKGSCAPPKDLVEPVYRISVRFSLRCSSMPSAVISAVVRSRLSAL